MELMEGVKGYSDSREEDEEKEEGAEEEIITSSRRLLHHHQDAAPSDFIINNNNNHTAKQLDFMDLSLGNTNKDEPSFQGSGGGASASAIYTHHHGNNVGSSSSGNSNHQQHQQVAEKEHMFDKVVTPSDVGKLNRLVIPKQHAEKYFPLDSTSNEKGLLLNFEDRNGKLWRFRYSYWNSSQSYVMTKGWSRFVKEKKLDAGDIVSFQRGVGELYRQRLYIDWRRRPDHQHQYHHSDPSSALFTPFLLPNHPQFFSIRWGATATASGRFYSLPSPTPLTPPRHHHDINYNNSMYHQQHPFHHGNVTHHHHYNNNYNEMSNTSTTSGSGSVYYLGSTTQIPMPLVDHQSLSSRQQQEGGGGGGNVSLSPMIIDSVPVAHHHHQQHHHNQQHHGGSTNSSSAGKRLRLFGVNMECASSTSEDPKCFDSNSLPSSSLPPLQLLREHTLPSPTSSTMFGDQRGEASMDPSNLQYRR